MKKATTHLRIALIIMAVPVLTLCLVAIPFILFNAEVDLGPYLPIMLSLYVPAIFFFLAMQQTFKLLLYVDTNQAFSELSLAALQKIKRHGVVVALFFTVMMPYIFYVAQWDDAPGVVLIGFLFIFIALTITILAAVFQKLLQNGMEIKSENDLTV